MRARSHGLAGATVLQRRVLAVLCVTEITSWGILYYALPVLAPSIAEDTGWSISGITAGFSIGLVVSALVGVPVGRWLDRIGPRRVMTAGSVLAVLSVVGIALAPTLGWFIAAWALAGVAMAGTLYPPAFAALTRWWGSRRVAALTALTVAAGLASTIFAPVTAALLERFGWRDTYLFLALALAVITVPAHVVGLRGPWPDPDPAAPAGGGLRTPDAVVRSRPFLLLAVALTLGALSAYAVIVNQVPLFIERGLSTGMAAWALGLGGLGQVLGRLAYGWITRVAGVTSRTVLILAATAATTGLLAVVPGPAVLLVAVAMLAGAARGVFILLQATAVSDRWGTAHYGRLNAVLSAPTVIATAVAPWAGAALAQLLGGYSAVFVLLAGIAALATLLAVGCTPRRN